MLLLENRDGPKGVLWFSDCQYLFSVREFVGLAFPAEIVSVAGETTEAPPLPWNMDFAHGALIRTPMAQMLFDCHRDKRRSLATP